MKSTYGQLVLEIKELMSNREFVPQKTHRSPNSVADWLDNYSRSERVMDAWLHSFEPCIKELWHLDYNTVNFQ